uniref:Uncharacterized protein n=1 Tax=Rhizophora mucronata TaxID=61149 RepID=A0A2P2PWB5_RHIMU
MNQTIEQKVRTKSAIIVHGSNKLLVYRNCRKVDATRPLN